MKARILSNNLHGGNYTTEFLEKYKDKEINNQLVIDWNLTEVLPGNNLHKPFWNGAEWIESATPEEIAQHNLSQLIQKETELYLKRMQDAQRIWSGLSAEFRLAKQMGQMDEATENIILAELKPVLDIIVPFGQWITGYKLLLNIGNEVIGETLYNKLHTIIWNYIQENYEEMEITALEKSTNKK